MTAAQQLDTAADIIEERGHVQGKAEGPNGEVCTAKALHLATGGVDEHSAISGAWVTGLHTEGARAIVRHGSSGGSSVEYICEWNNREGQNRRTVPAALRQFAQQERDAEKVSA